jgi:glycosyltransferase involved in cell wall biosynthesis
MKRYDVLVFGDLCSNDLVLGEFLARRGLRVCVARRTEAAGASGNPGVPAGFLRALSAESLVTFRRPSELVGLARLARLVICFTGSFGFALKWRWAFRRLLNLPPVINQATGSDFTELLVERSAKGSFYRYFARTCALNVGVAYPHILNNIVTLRLKNVVFLRYAYLLPEPSGHAEDSPFAGPLRFLHASHLDFKVNDPGAHRNSSKGNDRFLRALLRAIDQGVDAECVILDRGPDRKQARDIVEASPHASRFTWKPALSRDELFREMMLADIVVDQFDVGGLGGIAIEAMALGKPVMTYVSDRCLHVTYGPAPPVISARSEDEIFDAIVSHTDRAMLASIGRGSRQWAQQNHGWENCLDQLLVYFSLLTGHRIVDYVGYDSRGGR